ncbi:HNH endonuclease signature motif containing protein [Sorangium sp. So ce726]
MEIDHIIPESLGGPTARENLWLACSMCNDHNGNRIAAPDPHTGEVVRLFNPRQQVWLDHFGWNTEGSLIIGKTPTGRCGSPEPRRARGSPARLGHRGLASARGLSDAAAQRNSIFAARGAKTLFRQASHGQAGFTCLLRTLPSIGFPPSAMVGGGACPLHGKAGSSSLSISWWSLVAFRSFTPQAGPLSTSFTYSSSRRRSSPSAGSRVKLPAGGGEAMMPKSSP